jgi:VWFA-related protein
VKGLGLAGALVFAVVSAVPAQQPSNPSQPPQSSELVPQLPPAPTSPARPEAPAVFRSGASLVALNVTVTDVDKRFVRGLHIGDFAIYEDGVQQRVQFFEASDVPIDLILLIDGSSSMRDKMPIVHEAALGFLTTLRDRDRGAVVSFADTVSVVQALTTDRAALETAVKSTRAHGATALHNALYVSLKQFGGAAQQGSDVRRQAIAVLSDGEDTSSVVPFDDVLALARRSGVAIYTIRMQSEFGAARDQRENGKRYFSDSAYALRSLAQDTGGQAYFPEHIGQLKTVYAGIAQELSAQYSIGYTPSNQRRDGRFRRIIVQLPLQPLLKLRARAGYTADPGHKMASSAVHR